MTIASFYVPRRCAYRQLSAPTKLIVPLVLMTAAFLIGQPVLNAALVVLVAVLLRLAAIPAQVVRTFAAVLWTLIPVITVGWTIFFRSGEVLVSLGPIDITTGGLYRAIATDLRFTAIVLAVPLILAAMPQQDLVAALRWLRLPYVICFIIALALRTIPTLERDVGLIRDAQRSRGVELDRGGLRAKLRGLAAVVLPLMTVSIARLEIMSRVIESRGVTSRRSCRTFYRRPEPRLIDQLLMIGSLLALLALFAFGLTPAGRAVLS
ncbi:MAG: energy-coupling factor transporter transmembrane component T family protein [Candidatus Limnocylindria bacterium]